MTTRCKCVCTSKRQYKNWDRNKPDLYEYEFSPVTSGSEENKAFFYATPSGSVKFSTVSDATFEVGTEYYFDISKADAAVATA